ncbi:MAG: hypothetical protein Hyperionvirus23_4 [Hyperionvirus sp.]|uniref:Uncharacterized protein n=1 Tax=Hyperionvirus sp. TaxID=2487770 RepID=A0A3G5AAV3_9VIRU|nr:MAG: hypothetical protein Hyperionvirus23_4 [Hyperionvirus sp.]
MSDVMKYVLARMVSVSMKQGRVVERYSGRVFFFIAISMINMTMLVRNVSRVK